MRYLIFLIIIFVLGSCQNRDDSEMLKHTIIQFEKSEKIFSSDTNINILRKSSKKQEYEMRVKRSAGFAVFQVYPEQVIFKNFTTDSINMDFVKQFATLNINKDCVVQLLKRSETGIRIEVKISDKIYYLFRGDELIKSVSKKDSIFEFNNAWNYVVKEFIPER